MRSYALLSLGALASVAQAAIIDVDAGEHGFSYAPNNIKAAVGDEVHVHFYPGGHTFTQSSFNNPCSPLSGGVNSGVVNSNSGQASMMFSMTVNSTDPMWMYCGAPGHCSAGMALVINEPASGDSLSSYQSAASGKSGSAPSAVSGGALVANVDNDDDGNSSSSSSSGSSTASATGSTSTGTATAATTTTAAASSTDSGSSAQSTGNAASHNFAALPFIILAPAAAYLFS